MWLNANFIVDGASEWRKLYEMRMCHPLCVFVAKSKNNKVVAECVCVCMCAQLKIESWQHKYEEKWSHKQ